MSHLDARFANEVVTVWRSTQDEYGQETWARAGTFNASYTQASGEAIDDMGERYTPKISYYATDTDVVKYGDIVALGDILGSDPIALGHHDRVRNVKRSGNGFFGWAASIEVMV